MDLLNYDLLPDLLVLPPRPGEWDSALVESGPPPARLSNGDWFFIYNAAEDTGPSERPGKTLVF